MIKMIFLICSLNSTDCIKETSIKHYIGPKYNNIAECMTQSQMFYATTYYNQDYEMKYNEYIKIECSNDE